MQVDSLDPQGLVDYLLAAWVRWELETLSIEPVSDCAHAVSADLNDRALVHTEIPSSLADAAIARLALIGALDFTSREERSGEFRVRADGKEVTLHLSVRPASGHLRAHLRRPFVELAPLADPEVGEVPRRIGEYELFEEMGRGGLGVVYRAEHRLLHKPAAIKLLTASARAALSNAALVREARAAARTRHPGVVEVYDVVRLADGRFALIMELVEGESLAQRLVRTGPSTPLEALGFVRAIAEIMQVMHANGIVHRDLKPENAILLSQGGLKLLDFGAARPPDTDGGAVPDSTFGTPWYMAPEQAQGQPVDRRSDVYSLGCILFELLTGDIPFLASDATKVIRMHISSAVPIPTSPHEPLTASLESLVGRSLAKQPEARQQDMAELIREIDAVRMQLSRAGFRKWLTL